MPKNKKTNADHFNKLSCVIIIPDTKPKQMSPECTHCAERREVLATLLQIRRAPANGEFDAILEKHAQFGRMLKAKANYQKHNHQN
jgi:hypothetical protein